MMKLFRKLKGGGSHTPPSPLGKEILNMKEWLKMQERKEEQKALRHYYLEVQWSDNVETLDCSIFDSFQDMIEFIIDLERQEHCLSHRIYKEEDGCIEQVIPSKVQKALKTS